MYLTQVPVEDIETLTDTTIPESLTLRTSGAGGDFLNRRPFKF